MYGWNLYFDSHDIANYFYLALTVKALWYKTLLSTLLCNMNKEFFKVNTAIVDLLKKSVVGFFLYCIFPYIFVDIFYIIIIITVIIMTFLTCSR